MYFIWCINCFLAVERFNMEDLQYGVLLEDVVEYKCDVQQQRTTLFPGRPKRPLTNKQLAPKGTLVKSVSSRETEGNYKTILGSSFYLSCKPRQVRKLTVQQKNLLEGVKDLHVRTEVLHKLNAVQKLQVGSLVFVLVPAIPLPVQGVIRFIGELPGETGTKFGVEFLVFL